MKNLIAGLLAVLAPGGCVAVPYEPAPAGYYYGPPAPPNVYFSYSYRGGGGYYRHHH